MIYTNPLFGFLKTLLLLAFGKIHFSKESVGATIIMSDDVEFKIFRRVIIKNLFNKDKKPKGLFIVRFTPIMDIKKKYKIIKNFDVDIHGF